METIVIRVSGKVQGVFFRQATHATALQLGVVGTAQNLDDGRVEIIATGDRSQLDALVSWCRNGPPKARVEAVEAEAIALQHFDGFAVIR